MNRLSISLFGPFEVTAPDGAAIPLQGSKLQGLLAYLALNQDLPPSRDRLTALFWGDRFPDQARQSLRQAISKLRKVLDGSGGDVICAENDRVSLNPDRVTVDADRFMSLVTASTPEADFEATKLYNGALLEDLYVREQEFQDWLTSERQRIATAACPAFERAVEFLVRQGKSDAAIDLARRLISFDPLRENSHRLLMRVLAQNGQRAAAIQQYNSCAETLARELDIGPGPETQRLLEEIRQVGFATPAEEQLSEAPAPVVRADVQAQNAGVENKSTITILPFTSLAPGEAQGLFAVALGEDLTTDLAKFRWLELKASPVVDQERLSSERMRQFAGDHGLKYAISGTIRHMGDDLRLTVQLIGLEQGRYLWVNRYDRKTDDLFSILDDLAHTIAGSVEAELVSIEGLGARQLVDSTMTAWDCYHRGLSVQYEFSAETNDQAQRFFRRAVEMDPGFAAAYARLSYAMVLGAIYFDADYRSGLLDEALALAQKSCRLDPQDAVCRFALGRVYLARGEYERSLSEIEAAISLNPSMAQAHCALGDSLTYAGQPDAALRCFEKAVEISPQDPYRWAFLSYGAIAYLFKGDFEKSAQWASEASQVPNAHFWPKAVLASALGHLGRKEEASRALAELKKAKSDITLDFVRDRLFYLRDPEQVECYVGGLAKAGLK